MVARTEARVNMNPVPVLQSVGSLMCEVAGGVSLVSSQKHCEVGKINLKISMQLKMLDVHTDGCRLCVRHSVPHVTVVLDYSECLTIGRCLNLVVITAVTVLPCSCSPPQRTGPKCPPVWPLHNTSGRWSYGWVVLTSTSYSPVYQVSATSSLYRNCLFTAENPVSACFVGLSLHFTTTLLSDSTVVLSV